MKLSRLIAKVKGIPPAYLVTCGAMGGATVGVTLYISEADKNISMGEHFIYVSYIAMCGAFLGVVLTPLVILALPISIPAMVVLSKRKD